MTKNLIKLLVIFFTMHILLSSCGTSEKLKNIRKPVDLRNQPLDPDERALKNIKEGKGISLAKSFGKGGRTSYEFSTSNPVWRASLETLDFLPLATIDYSGGMIITDWYSDDDSKESIKISVRFLGNNVASENLKIIVHKKTCADIISCRVNLLTKSKIEEELHSTIIRKAAVLAKKSKEQK